jgi:penicillin-insensitive murein endopeptidase
MKHIIIAMVFLFLIPISARAEESVCYGTASKGRLEHGVRLPSEGKNFVSYGRIPELAGRTYVHSKARDVILEAYAILEREQPGKVFKYAETGLKDGGRFKPHKTHQNGLSVDFIVPVVDESGKSVHLPTHPLNKYGYSIEFNEKGAYGNFKIDYEAMGAHIVALHRAAKKHGIGIHRVLFDPTLQWQIYNSTHGNYIKKNIKIPKKHSWVRHDDHYHVDFAVVCGTY